MQNTVPHSMAPAHTEGGLRVGTEHRQTINSQPKRDLIYLAGDKQGAWIRQSRQQVSVGVVCCKEKMGEVSLRMIW